LAGASAAVATYCILRQNESSKSMEGYRRKFLIVKEEGSGAPGGTRTLDLLVRSHRKKSQEKTLTCLFGFAYEKK
jgi:hypothetical protein